MSNQIVFITRFNPEEKAKRSPFHWMPFGYGPRNCIGMRLALFEIKVAIIHVLKKHKLVKCAKTEVRRYFIPLVVHFCTEIKKKKGSIFYKRHEGLLIIN